MQTFVYKLFPFLRIPFHAAAVGLKGRREENQDNFLILRRETGRGVAIARYLKDEQIQNAPVEGWTDSHVRVAAADGMGGHMMGRQIAEAAISALISVPPQTSPEGMRTALTEIHQSLQSRFDKGGNKRPGTTLVWADIDIRSRKGVMLTIGDSRAYLIRKRKWRQLTCDHTLEEFAFRDGGIGDKEYQKQVHMKTNRMTQALSYGSFGILKDDTGYKPLRLDKRIRLDSASELPKHLANHADVFSFRLAVNDVLLLASDGLWNSASDGQWRGPDETNGLFPSQSVAENLAHQALRSGSTDNITAVIGGFGSGAS